MERNQGHKTPVRFSINTREAKHNHRPQRKDRISPIDVELKLGWDQANRKSVALKTFTTYPYIFDHHPCRQLVEFEIKSMDRVSSHDNIVRLVDVMVRSPSNVCLVMEAAAASRGNLMETIAAAPEGRLSQVATRFYLSQLLDAVQYCHASGVCHRDIQPQHLLVDARSGNMKLSSFGRAGLWDTTKGDAADLAYASSAPDLTHAAPEVLKGSTYCGKAADCWSMGAVLFTMLAGFSPFKTDGAEMEVCDPCFQSPRWVSPLARSLLVGMMEPDPEKRFTVADIRSHPWLVGERGGDRMKQVGSSFVSGSSSSGDDGDIEDSTNGSDNSLSSSDGER